MLSRSVLTSLLPQGRFWEPEFDSDYDHLLDGIAENSEVVYLMLQEIAWFRDPMRTPVLSDLENEYGVIPATFSTESERRLLLKSFMFKRSNPPTAENLQQKLRDAGFTGVFVYPNDPPVDPNIFLAENYAMMCNELLPGGNDPQCGEPEAQCSLTGGELVVNGDLFTNIPNYKNQCGNGVYCNDNVYCGDVAGYITTVSQSVYAVPADPGYWGLIFFVGGPATFDPVTGELLTIEQYSVPNARRTEFRRIILRHKPLYSWGGLIIVYT